MPKALAITGMVVSLLLLLIFGLDAGVGWPFGEAVEFTWDVMFAVAALVLAYMSWTTFREQP